MTPALTADPDLRSTIPDLRYVSFTEIAKMDPVTLKKALGLAGPSLPILPESDFSSSI